MRPNRNAPGRVDKTDAIFCAHVRTLHKIPAFIREIPIKKICLFLYRVVGELLRVLRTLHDRGNNMGPRDCRRIHGFSQNIFPFNRESLVCFQVLDDFFCSLDAIRTKFFKRTEEWRIRRINAKPQNMNIVLLNRHFDARNNTDSGRATGLEGLGDAENCIVIRKRDCYNAGTSGHRNNLGRGMRPV